MKIFSLYIIILLGALAVSCQNDDINETEIPPQLDLPASLPNIDLAVFSNSTLIDNRWYGPGGVEIYKYEVYNAADNDSGTKAEQKISIQRKTTTRRVMGINCIIQWEQVKEDDIIVKDTDVWLAQDDMGNIWYMGEDTKNYDALGNFQNSDGSWTAWTEAALPGHWLPAKPLVGLQYYRVYLKGEIEEQAEVISVNETISIEPGTFNEVVKIREFSALNPDSFKLKYYALGTGLIKEEVYENNELAEVILLVEIFSEPGEGPVH